MKTISIVSNIKPIVYVNKIPALYGSSFTFGFAPGGLATDRVIHTPILRIGVDLSTNDKEGNIIKLATYETTYKMEGEGLIIEDNIYSCCQTTVHGMKTLIRFHPVGRSIPQEIFLCSPKEAFEDDLIQTAKELNAIDGKRGFPLPKP